MKAFYLILLTFIVGVEIDAWGWDSLGISGNPGSLIISDATAGSPPSSVSDSSTTYQVISTSSSGTRKITGRINTNMPSGVTLTLQLAAPSGATSQGAVSLNTSSKNLVTGINNIDNWETRGMTYELSCTSSAGVISSQSVTVTLTIST